MKTSRKKMPKVKQDFLNNSYYGRYLGKVNQVQAVHHKPVVVSGKSCHQREIAQRREKIISSIQRNHETSIIRIEDELNQSVSSKHFFPEQESALQIKIAEIKQKLERIYLKIADGQRSTKQIEQMLAEKKTKQKKLFERREELTRAQQQIWSEEEHDKCQLQPLQIELKVKENEEEIKSLKADQEMLNQQIKKIESQLSSLRLQYKRLQGIEETEQTIEDFNDLVQENQKIKQRIQSLEKDNAELQEKSNNIQSSVWLGQQLYRRFADLYEKLFIGRELNKLQKLMQAKQQMFRRQQEFQLKKNILKQKKKEMDQIEKRVQEQKRYIQNLEADIVQKSTLLLEVTHENT